MADHLADNPPPPGRLRLIGFELRLRDPFGVVEEVEMLPLRIELAGCANAALTWTFGPNTLHTSVGDVAIPEVRLPSSGR